MATIHSLRMLCFERNDKIMDLERRIKQLEEVAKMAVSSQGWDGNNDERWLEFYRRAKASLESNTSIERPMKPQEGGA